MKGEKHTGAADPAETRRGGFRPSIVFFLLFFCLLLKTVPPASAAEISEVTVRLANNEIHVSTLLKPDSRIIDDMNGGITKEFVFYIDLFRIWNVWPDEFILGTKVVRILRSNQIKREYVASSFYGNVHLEKRFKDLDSMVGWAFSIQELKLANVRELEQGTYFVKVTVESRIKKLPPVVGYLLFFVPEKELSIYRNSPAFTITTKGQ
ncbi:MAG: DUF4390 domain-containing protein [Alphaproteobacteria bacterium]|uniref:DUF4390 domain-containing protein n=1 Tax=Candidatus Nitrobium versatile TaxID=2884831 RepID=A0A953J3T6_9BACT|nr:DUF4390 domain-containing protein [Candidatus Nitrobium versatile]